MASNIQLPTTQVADTGTGALLTPYNLFGDLAIFRESAPSAAPALLQYKRTEAKATKDYAGAMRGEARFTRQMPDAAGKLWPCVMRMESSLPAFLTDAERSALVLEAVMAFSLSVSQDVLSKLTVPQ